MKKFDRTNDFGLCQIKMKTLLVQYGLEGALEREKKVACNPVIEGEDDGDVEGSKRHPTEFIE